MIDSRAYVAWTLTCAQCSESEFSSLVDCIKESSSRRSSSILFRLSSISSSRVSILRLLIMNALLCNDDTCWIAGKGWDGGPNKGESKGTSLVAMDKM